MPKIVEEGRDDDVAGALAGDSLPEWEVPVDAPEPRHEALHDVRGAERMRKPRVLGAGKRERSEAELANAPQALHLGALENARDDGVFFALEGDEAMYGVAQDHAVQAAF